MTIGRDIIAQAFPGQPRMQAAFEDLVADAEDLLGRLETAATALAQLQGDTANVTDILAGKQNKSDMLAALSLVGADPGVLEQVSPGIVSVRQVDTADTASLMTRALADTRYLGGAHAAASATKLATARSITASGDAAWTVTFDGSANVSAALTLATVNSNTGTFGGASTVPQISVDGKGRITGVTAVPIAGPSGAALTKTDDTNVTLTLGGTPASALLQAVSITVGWTGTLAVTRGGTGTTTSTGTGSVVLSASPTLTGTLTAATIAASGRATVGGGIRATGFSFSGATGLGGELLASGGEVNLNSYDRTASAFAVLNVQASTIKLNPGGTITLTLDSTFGNFANDAAAAAGGVPVKGIYRNGSVLMVRVV